MKKTTVIYFCDRCGKEIQDEFWKIRPHCYTMNQKEEMSDLFMESMDREYCKNCALEIMGYAAVTLPAKKKEKKEEKTTPRTRTESHERLTKNKRADQPIDKGKIFALRNAGWSWDEIRKEIRLELQDSVLEKLYQDEKTRRENMDHDQQDTEDSALYWNADI